MSCPTDVVEWQVAHWIKMSRQRCLSECVKYSNENTDNDGKLLDDNVDINRCKNSVTLLEYHKEDHNPWTRDWRESLRTWNYSCIAIPDTSETKKKKASRSKEQNTVK
jgi:hypothetical protein